MTDSFRNRIGRRLRFAAALWALTATSSWAQYRPPPMTESQRAVTDGEAALVEATRANTSGERKRAEAAYRKALGLFEQALTADPQNVAAAAGLGTAGNGLQDYARVSERLAPVAATHPDALEVAFPLGTAYFKLRRFSDALPLLEKASAVAAPEYLLAHYYLGSYFLYAQGGEAAIAAFNRYLNLRPKELAGNDYQVHELIGRGYVLLRRPQEARAAFGRAQAGRPEWVGAQLGLASVLELEGKSNESLSLLEGLNKRFPKSPEPKERLASLYLATGDLGRAEKFSSDLIKLGSTPQAHMLLGEVRLAQKQFKVAEGEFRRALELSPGWVTAQAAVAKALQQQGRNEEAITYLESAAKASPGNADLWAVLGSVNRRANRFQRALEVHRRVVEMTPNQARGYVLLGADHFATGQWDQAIEDYASALQVQPGHPDASRWLAQALAHRARDRVSRDRLDDAVRDLRRAYDLDRSVPMARRLTAALLAQRSYPQAKAVAEQATAQPAAGWYDHFLLGYARIGAQDAPGAVAAFERAIQLGPNAEQVPEVQVGLSLAQVEAGQLDAALERLRAATGPKAAALAQANLPQAHLRRALARLHAGDGPGAAKDIDAAERADSRKSPELGRFAQWVQGLVRVEEGRFAEAKAATKKALSPTPRWAEPNAPALTEAFVAYRANGLSAARKALSAGSRRAGPKQSEWLAQLAQAIDEREGERAYAQGAMAKAETAFRSAAAAAPEDPKIRHNLACVAYRKGRVTEALEVWKQLQSTLPQASMNLGIDAQERQKNYDAAVGFYQQYVAANGPKAAVVKEWKERLQSFYGIAEAAPAASGGGR